MKKRLLIVVIIIFVNVCYASFPIETVSKMLWHNNIKTTQLYARVIDSKISSDMLILRQKFI